MIENKHSLLRNATGGSVKARVGDQTPRTLKVRKSILPAIDRPIAVTGKPISFADNQSTNRKLRSRRSSKKGLKVDMSRFAGSIVQNDYHQLLPTTAYELQQA